MNSDDKPTVEAYNAETGEYLGEGTVVEPEYPWWKRGSLRFKRTVVRNPKAVFVLAILALLALQFAAIL